MGCVRAHPDLRAIIEKEASANGLDPDFLEAVALTENANYYPNKDPGTLAPWIYLDTDKQYAHGIMAVHIPAAIDAGFVGVILVDGAGRRYAPELATKEGSIKYGARYLARRGFVVKPPCAASDFACRAACYVQGSPTRNPDGSWTRQNYVDNVRFHYNCITGRFLPDERKPADRIQQPGEPGPDPPQNPPPNQGSTPCIGFNIERERILPNAPMPSLPFFAFFSVGLTGFGDLAGGGIERTGRVLTPPRPQYITRFELEESNGGMNTCYIRFFDPNWDFAELVGSYTPKEGQTASVSFGYVNYRPAIWDPNSDVYQASLVPEAFTGLDLWSPEYQMYVHAFHPEYLGWGVEIELVLKGNGMKMHLNHETRQYQNMKISDIWGQIAERHDMKLCTVPTTSLMCEGAGLESALPEEKPFSQDESDLVFTNRLLMEAVSDEVRSKDTNEPIGAGYTCRIDDTLVDGKKVLHVHAPPLTAPFVRQYTYMRQQLGTVIQWSPDFQETALARIGGVRADMRGFDPNTKEFRDCSVDIDSMKDADFNGPPGPSHTALLGSNLLPVRTVFPSAEGPIANFCVEGLNFFRRAYSFQIGGTLIVLGDPLIRPSRNVMLLVFTFRSVAPGAPLVPVLSFTSGIYNILEVRHVIQGGEYLTIMRLLRNGALPPEGVDPTGPEGGIRPPEETVQSNALDVSTSSTFLNTYPNNIVR